MERERENDEVWKDLSEKKKCFRRHVASLAADLHDARARLASQDHFYATQALTTHENRRRKVLIILVSEEAEIKAKNMEEEVCRLHNSIDERDAQLQESLSTVDKFLKDLDNLRKLVSAAQATADASAELAQSAQLQCLTLSTELDLKNSSLKEHEAHINRLGEHLNRLQNDLQAKEVSDKQLREEVLRIEHDVMQATAKGGGSEVIDEFCPRKLEKINKILKVKDQEIVKLRDETRNTSGHWKLKAEDLESQLKQHKRDDLELKKRVVKLEFYLQEARALTRRLQKTGERRDKVLKELKDEVMKQGEVADKEKKNFWESSGFKIVVSMSMLILVLFSRR